MSIRNELVIEEMFAYPNEEKLKRLRAIIDKVDRIKGNPARKLKYKPSMLKY